MTSQPSIPRLNSLESLRGILALWVMFGHIISASGLYYQYWPKPFYYLGMGNFAVDVFIIISGFVIFLLLDQKKETYKVFILRRFFRIYPVYFICLLCSIPLIPISFHVLQNLSWHDVHNAIQLQVYQDSQNFFWGHLVAHLFLLHGLFDVLLPSSSVALLGPAWSLSLEWQFYLLAPWLYLLLKKRSRFGLMVILALVLWASSKFELGIGNLLCKSHYFLIGIGSYYLWKHRASFRNFLADGLGNLILIGAFLILMFTDQIPLLIWEIFFFSLIAVDDSPKNFRFEKYLIHGLEWKPLLWVGKISFPIYLVHFLVMYSAMYFMKDLQLGKKVYFMILLPSVTVFTLVFSALLHQFVEKPFIQLGRRIS